MGMIRTLQQVEKFFSNFNSKIFSFDTETTSLSYDHLQIEGLSVCDGKQSVYIDLIDNPETGQILHYLKWIFEGAELLIAHNAVFDLKVLYKYGIYPQSEIYDTMIADHLLDERERHGLKIIAARLLNVDTIAYTQAEEAGRQSDIFYKYAENDAVWTYQIAQIQKPQLKEQGLIKLFREIEMPYQYVLLEMAVTGVLIDTWVVKKTTKELRQEYENVVIEMLNELDESYELQIDLFGNASVVSSVNFNSTGQLKEIMFDKLGLQVIETTPGGSPSVGKKTIATYKKTNKFVQLLNKYKIISKLLSGFFIPLPEHLERDGRVRPNFRDTGTKTGRLSCTKPNLQQLPKANDDFPIQTRAAFTVPNGYKMIACDYSGQELRVLAHISRSEKLIDTFIKGKDMHLSTANDFFELGIPEEELYSNNSMKDVHKKRYKNERDKAKTINFGMAYGKGAYGFSKDFGITEVEAQKILDKYFAALPKVKLAIDTCHQSVRKDGYVTSLTGRKRRFSKVTRDDWTGYPSSAFRQSFNFLIQGYSADMIRKASIATYSLSKKHPEWDMKQIMSVHDENVYQVKEEYAEEAAKKIKEAFESVEPEFSVPLKADVSVGNNYSQIK